MRVNKYLNNTDYCLILIIILELTTLAFVVNIKYGIIT